MALTLSVVVPVYGCARCLEPLCARIAAVLADEDCDYEIVLVDDCSLDGGWFVIERMAAEDSRIGGVRLARNCGQQAAIAAGLTACRGEAAVVMDCDLQDPPEEIPRLLDERARAEIVLVRYGRRADPLWRRLATDVLARLTGATGGGSSTFSLISRKAIDAYLSHPGAGCLYAMVLRRLGLSTRIINTEKNPRAEGQSSYTLGRLVGLAWTGLRFRYLGPQLGTGPAFEVAEVIGRHAIGGSK